jgi:hypothetical protein
MSRALSLASVACLVLMVGCALSPVYLANRSSMERCLPSGVTMDTYVDRDWTGLKVNVGMKLARLGAYARDGQLYDGLGRPIEFYSHDRGGAPMAAEVEQHAYDHLQELKKTHTVIEMFRDPDLPPPV